MDRGLLAPVSICAKQCSSRLFVANCLLRSNFGHVETTHYQLSSGVRVKVISAIRHVRQDRYLGWIISIIALGLCVSIRFYIDGYGEFLGSGALMPAVMIAGLFGGVTAGITVFAISSFVLFFFFVPPHLTFEIGRSSDVRASSSS